MRYISIQKKPTFYSELLMVFINSLFYFSTLRYDYFYKDTKYILIKQVYLTAIFTN
jgi:hypothetical protein